MATRRTTARRSTWGTVTRNPGGNWRVRVPDPDRPDRKLSLGTFLTKADADAALSQARFESARGLFVAPQQARITVAAWWELWWPTKQPTLKIKTQATYLSVWKVCVKPTLGEIALGDITRHRVNAWTAELTTAGRSASRVRQAVLLLSQLFDAAIDDRRLATNPCTGSHRPRLPDSEPTVLTPEQVEQLASAMPAPYGLLVRVLAYSGMRIGEVFALRRRHVDLLGRAVIVEASVQDTGTLLIIGPTKTYQHHRATLPASVLAELEAHLAALPANPEALLWPARTGGPMRYGNFRRIWDKARDAAGLPGVTPHHLRDSCGSWVAARFGPLVAAQQLGHRNAYVTTKHYARPLPGAQVELADHLDEIAATTARPTQTVTRLTTAR